MTFTVTSFFLGNLPSSLSGGDDCPWQAGATLHQWTDGWGGETKLKHANKSHNNETISCKLYFHMSVITHYFLHHSVSVHHTRLSSNSPIRAELYHAYGFHVKVFVSTCQKHIVAIPVLFSLLLSCLFSSPSEMCNTDISQTGQ